MTRGDRIAARIRRRRPARAVVVALALPVALVLLLAACSLPFGGNPMPGLTCEGVPEDTCRDYAVDLGLGRDPTIVGVRLVCQAPPCTPDAGQVLVTVRRADGTVEESGFGWQAGGPGPDVGPPVIPVEPPTIVGAGDVVPACVGVPEEDCAAQFEQLLAGGAIPLGRTLVAVTVRCTGICTPGHGTGQLVATLDDGTTLGYGWSTQTIGP